YQIPRLESLPSGLSTRVRRLTIIVYHRGYVGWRSDRRFPGRLARRDFSQRGNRVRLEKWMPTFAHVEHLLFLDSNSRIRTATAWEAQTAAMELEGERDAQIAGRATELPGAPGVEPAPSKVVAAPLDVAHLLTDDEIRG